MPGKREKSAKEGVGAQNVTTINKLRKMLSLRNSLQSLAKLSGAQKDMTLSGASGTCKRGSGKEVVGPAMHASGDEEIEQLKAFRERVKADVAGAETGVSLKAAPRHKYASSYGVDDFALTMSDAEDGRKRASSLHLSAAAGDIVAVRQMIEDGCDVNEHDKKYSSLHMAVRTADQDMVQLLLDSGAIIDKRDRDGWAPLHVACMLGCAKIARQLLNSGASLNCLTEDGMSALHCAVHVRNCVSSPEVEKRCREVMNELLSWGMKINAKDYQGWTALHVAVQNGSLALVKELLDLGADVCEADNYGYTPIDYVPVARGLYHQNKDVEKLLRSHIDSL